MPDDTRPGAGRARLRPALLVLTLLAAGHSPAWAHRLKVFAAADGAVIRGRAYTSAGTPLCDVPLQVCGPDGRHLGEVTTDGAGEFAFTATVRCAHTFILETADGHAARFTVSAAELPAELPAPAATATAAPPPAPHAPTETVAPATGLAEEIRLLRQQVAAHRAAIDAYEERRRVQDLIGGVGYLLGIAGLFFFLKARQTAP